MESKIRKNPKTIILVILFVVSLLGNMFLISKNVSSMQEYASLFSKYQEKKKLEKEQKEQLLQIEKDRQQIAQVEENLAKVKQEYFATIKQLEDDILSGKSEQKIAYLTFDDGPYYSTYQFLDILDRYDVKATFFTTSINGEKCYDKKSENCLLLYQEYIKRGHTIANHTFTHGIYRGLYRSTDSFIAAVKRQEEVVQEYTPVDYTTNIVRFPGGSRTSGKLKDEIIAELRKMNYGWVDWTAQDGDGGNLTSKEQAWSNFTSSINENIEVILFHDYNAITLSILPDAIEYLQNHGYLLFPLFYESNMIQK